MHLAIKELMAKDEIRMVASLIATYVHPRNKYISVIIIIF